MADRTINIKIDEAGNKIRPTKVTRTSVNDSAANRQLAETLKKALQQNAKEISGSTEKTLKTLVRDIVRSKTGGQAGISDASIAKIVKAATREVGSSVVSSILKNLPKNQTKSMDSTAFSRAIEASLDKQAQKIAQTLSNKLGKIGVKVEAKDFQSGISGVIRQAFPKSMETSIKDLSSAAGSMKTLLRDISQVLRSIKSMRQSGGKIDVSEIGKVLSGLKVIAKDFKDLSTESNKAKAALANMGSESKIAIKELSEAIGNVKAEAKKLTVGARERATGDPKAFTKEVVSALTNVIKKSETLKNTEFGKAISSLEGKIGDISKLTNELKKFQNTLKREVGGGKVNIEGVDKVLREFNNIITKLGNVPKEMGIEKTSKEWEKLSRAFNNFTKKTSELSTQIKVVIDDTEIQKLKKQKIELPVKLAPEKKELYNDVKLTIENALEEAGKRGIRPKVDPIVKDIELAVKEDSVDKLRKSLQKLTNLDLSSSINKAANKLRGGSSLLEVETKLNIDASEAKKKLENIKKEYEAMGHTARTMARTRDITTHGPDITSELLYKKQVIKPSPKGQTLKIKEDYLTKLSSEAEEIKTSTEANMKRLSKSLFELQKNLVTSLDKEFADLGKKWAVVKSPEAPATSAFNLKPGGRQWTLEIANVDRLQKVMKNFGSSVDVLVKDYKRKSIDTYTKNAGSPTRFADLIGQWLKTVSVKEVEGVEGIDKSVAEQLKELKKSHIGIEVGESIRKAVKKAFGEGKLLEDIFRKTYGEAEAKRQLQREGLVKTVALPAAGVSRSGETSFQTTHGSRRALPKFVKFETGFEVLNDMLEKFKKYEQAAGFQENIRDIGVRPGPGRRAEAEDLAINMLRAVVKAGREEGIAFVRKAYKSAALQKGFTEKEPETGAIKLKEDVDKVFSKTYGSFDEFAKAMKAVSVSAYDVAKGLNKIETKNVYDILNDVLKGNKEISPIRQLGRQPNYERSIREFEAAINEVEGVLPLIEPNRPRRGYHQENVVNLLTRASTIYGNDPQKDRLTPDEQKKLIKDLNIELNDTLERREKAGIKLPPGIKRITSLGIPESQAGSIDEFRTKGGTGQFKYLKTINATGVKMYAEDLTSLAPFQQFQQAGRNISNVTAAMTNLGKAIETPKLRSERERALLESGRYGKQGYGYNVVAELRNTAANFEDQIVISGKLAKALTQAVSILVKPHAVGRVRGGSLEEKVVGTSVSDIKPVDLKKVAGEYMRILGIPQTYKGRADVAEIKGFDELKGEIEKAVAVVRGQDVGVQRAKLAETFLNYFGRKLTTRYGSKGVSITPTGQRGDLAKIIEENFGKKIKVNPEATLGYQVAPKSLGKLASELFSLQGGKDVSEDLKNRLKKSGNKFLIDMFQDVNIVSTDEAERTKKLYDDFAEAWQKVFKSDVPKPGVAGIKQLKETYTKQFGAQQAFKVRPIEVRISSYGAAKRGLQTEFLESIVSNLASVADEGVTTLKQLQKVDYERLLGKGGKPGALSKYSAALGYTGAGKTSKELEPELFKIFGGKGEFETAKASGDEKAILAQRAAALEAASSFYSNIVDEFGKVRKGLVGEKFLQIVEEPTEDPEWQRGQIEKGLKGARLNLPAFSAYATIFGKESDIIKEVQKSLDLNAKKHWEYLKALETVQDRDSDLYKNLTDNLKTVDIKEVNPFTQSTGVYGRKNIVNDVGELVTNLRSFSDTVLDIEKYPEAFKLAIPTGKYNKEGKPEKEEFYVPGAAARATYPEPLLAGERGLDQISRRLTHVVNTAKELENVLESPEDYLDVSKLKNKITPTVGSWIENAWKLASKGGPEAESQIEKILQRMVSGLSTELAPSPALIKTGGLSEYDYAQQFTQKQLAKAEAGYVVPKTGKKLTRSAALASAVSTVGDLLIGKKGEGASPEQLAAPTGLSRALETGTGITLAKKLGIDVAQDEINAKVAALQKAKIDYYDTLASTVTGKSGTINELFFTRKIPAVVGKAVTAVVDKKDDIVKFQKQLKTLEDKYGENFSDQTSKLQDVAKEHAEAIEGYRKIGVPVLKQEELGVPEQFAKKVPLEFTKRYEILRKNKTIAKRKPEKVEGTLLDLLKYTQDLSKFASSDQSSEVSKYIEDELVPYIESIRFPFTGTSSIAPFKPKLLKKGAFKDKGGRALEKNALIVPGIPEGLEGLSPIIESLNKKVESASVKREELRTSGGPQEEIDRLSSLIRELNAAISNIIPKYVAQAQKLDFDGDTIEIHAAKTAAARKDIEKHFKRFHEATPSQEIKTQDVFMRRFLSEAANVKRTGPYVLGEAAGAFEKKFPAGKGFEFLKSPFLTKELEYLKPEEILNILEANKNTGGALNAIRDVLKDIETPEETVSQLISQISKLERKDPKAYVSNILKIINTSYSDLLDQIEKGIRKRLHEEKIGDVVEAQLFKVHTGIETEALYRVHRLGETAAGFGGGLISPERQSNKYFKSRFPSGKAASGNPEEEFNTMLNELVRFGIQKGMDVKHAGEKPIAGELVSYLSKGVKGAADLWKRINDDTDKSFGDLRDFAKDSAGAINMRLGELSTEDVLKEAKKIAESRGEETYSLDNKSRQELIDIIIKQVGFEGFLKELSLLIKKEAIEGLVSQAEQWSPAKKAKPGKGLKPIKGDIRTWAERTIAEQIASGGIDIRQSITEAQSPLYSSRTFFASPAAEQRKFQARFGEVPVPKGAFSKLDEKDRKRYTEKYKRTIATAVNVQQELKSFTGTKQTGAYAELINGTIDALHEQQSEIETYATSLIKEGYDPELTKKADLAERVISKKGVSSFANSVISMRKGMSNEVERLSDLASIPALSDTELFEIKYKTSKRFANLKKQELKAAGKDPKEFQTEIGDYVDEMVAKAQALAQLDRVTNVILARRGEGKVLQDIIPKELPKGISYAENKRQVLQEARSRIKEEKTRRSLNIAPTLGREKESFIGAPNVPKTGGMLTTSGPGGVVPVHIVSADPAATINVRGISTLTSIGGGGGVQSAPEYEAKEKRLKSILAKTKAPVTRTSETFEKFITPSRLAGGGDVYGFGKKPKLTEEQRLHEQLNRLVKTLTVKQNLPKSAKAITDIGTALHAKLEKFLENQANIDTERYGEFEDAVGGTIAGTADIIEYATPNKKKVSKVIDIKTTNAKKLEQIKKAVETTGTTNLPDVIENVNDQLKRQLNDYFSQLNTYLKIFDEQATAELRFYDREKGGEDINAFEKLTFKFDPNRFKSDVGQLVKAREQVAKSGKTFVGAREIPTGTPAVGASIEELNEAIKIAKELYSSYSKQPAYGKAYTLAREKDIAPNMKEFEGVKKAEDSARKKHIDDLKKYHAVDDDRYMRSPELFAGQQAVPTGRTSKDFLSYLKVLQEETRIFQRSQGVGEESLQRVPEQIKKAIESAGEKGPQYESFIELTKKLKDIYQSAGAKGLGGKQFTGKDFLNVWKLYKLAVGDYYVKLADQAYEDMKQAESEGEPREARQAYSKFTTGVSRAQDFVRRNLGKRTDPYTFGNRFPYVGIAEAAGVYQTPEEIAKRAGEPLGDDQRLIDTFKKVTKGLGESNLKAPIASVREIFRDLSDMNTELTSILSNAERFGRLGPDVLEAWNFDKLTVRVTRLRAALQQVLKESGELNAEQRKNIENIVKYLRNIEGMYSHLDLKNKSVGTGIVPVNKFETPDVQRALHARNIQSIREYIRKPEEEGGQPVGQAFSYTEKVVGQAGEVLKNVRHDFKKYGEVVDEAGNRTGQFSEVQVDLIDRLQRTSATFGNAVKRVVLWGAASRLVYGGMSKLKGALDELANIQVGIAQLRVVMSPLETDFNKLSKSATGFAKQYGVPVTDVLKSMKVFAQQGLKQEEVVDRTQAATLASNVTTLNAKDATEALTAAMKIFREEGGQSLRFLDAWSEVESKHAITAEDMANAIKKSAAAAHTAGITFDQLNGMIAAVGAVTRQSGKEIGTSFRFIFRRLFSEEGPKALAKLNIPTITKEGELRPAFNILGDLAGKWKDLTSAQKLNIAQSIGGTRQYNSLLVLLDQWDEALRGIRNSTNSKGSAERRNAEIMKTYAKQLERTKAAATEFKLEIGKVILPVFTAGTKSLTFLLETLTAIPTPVKAAAAALAAFFTLGAKGINIIDTISGGIGKGGALFSDLATQFKKQMSIAKYEVFGKGDVGTDTFGLKTVTPTATKTANALKGTSEQITKQGTNISDFHSILGKTIFQFMSWGKAYNEMIGGMVKGTGELTEKVGEGAQTIGGSLSLLAGGKKGLGGLKDILQGNATKRGLGATAVKETLRTQGVLKGGTKLLGKVGGLATEVAGVSTYLAGKAVDAVGEALGGAGQKIIKSFASENTGFVKAVAPLALTITALVPALKASVNYMGELTKSAQDYEKSMAGARRLHESQIKSVRDLVQEYDTVSKKLEDITKVQQPDVKQRRQKLGTYEAPLKTLQSTQQRATDLSNSIADSNLNLIAGYDKLGNAVLKTTSNYKNYLKEVERIEMKAAARTELDILGKYTEDLTSGKKSDKIKKVLKELAAAFPVVGNLATKGIKISPTAALEEATKDINKRLNLKQKYPLSTAADEDIKRLQKVLAKARNVFNETFGDLQKTYNKILSPANLKGLSESDIEDLLKSPELQKARELIIEINPKFKLTNIEPNIEKGSKAATKYFKELNKTKNINTLLGRDTLVARNQQLGGLLDFNSEFTKANLESAGIIQRQGKAFSGDIITLYKDFADKYNIAGAQAIVKIKDTDDWVIEYFNTRTLKVEELPIDQVEGLVDGIFPIKKIEENLSYRIDALNTFVAGAAAGLSGISAKDFKRDFNLGERFFSEIPTTTLLQGNKGFQPGAGYGNVEALKNFKKDIDQYFFKPMEELKQKTEQFEKLKLEGLDEGDVTVSKDFYEEVNKLLDILKNNQVVLQFKSVFVDLMKEMSAGQRVLKEDIAIMRRRTELDVNPGGLAAGVPRGLENLDLGIRKLSDLTATQQLLGGNKGFREGALRLKELERTSQNNLDMADKFERALVQIDDIMAVAKGFGAALKPEKLGEYVEKVTSNRQEGPFYELKQIDTSIEKNTANTVDKLDQMLENAGDPTAIERLLSDVRDNLGRGLVGANAKKTVNALERVARVRKKAEDRGEQDVVLASNKAIDVLTKQLVTQVGYKKGVEMVDKNMTLLRKRFTPEEFQQRAFGGVDPRVIISKLKEAAPGRAPEWFRPWEEGRPALADSKAFKNFERAQQKQVKETIFSSKNLARVAAVTTALSKIQQSGNKGVISKLDDQIKSLDEALATAPEEKTAGLTRKKAALISVKEQKQREADFYGTVSAISATSFAATELARAFGLTETQVKALGVGSAGLYTAMTIASKITGEKLPDSAKKFGDELKKVGGAALKGEKPGIIAARELKNLGKKMGAEFADRTKKVFGDQSKEIGDAVAKSDVKKIAKQIDTTKDIQSYGKKLTEGLDKAEAPSALKKALVAYLAVGLADFASNRSAQKNALAETSKLMKEQSEALAELINEYPDAADQALKEAYARAEKSTKQLSELATVDKPLVQDTEKAKEEIKKQIKELRDTYIEEQKKALEEQRKVQLDLADKRIRQEDKNTAYRAVAEEKNRRVISAISKKYSLKNVIQEGLGNFAGDFELPIPKDELSTQQRLYTESGSKFKNMINAYADGTNQLDTMRRRIEQLASRMAEEAELIASSADSEEISKAKKRYEGLSSELEKQSRITDEYANKLKAFGSTYMYLDRFAGSVYQLQNALKEVGIQEAVNRIPGLLKLNEELDKLLGGGHPEAVQAITPEEERTAARVGVDLTHLRSTKYDVEEAKLKEQLRTATGQQAADIQQQLSELPERRRRELQTREQQRFDEGLKRSLTPFTEQLTSLEKVKALPGITPEADKQISDYQSRIAQVLSRATERIPIEDYAKELKASRGKIGQEAYEVEKSRLDKLSEAGIKSVYRGVTPLDKQELTKTLPDEIKAAMKEAAQATGEGLSLQANISDPIVAKIDETNAILKQIAEEKFGLKVKQSNIENSGNNDGIIKKLFNIPSALYGFGRNIGQYAKDKFGKAAGGFISGPGGPKEDKIPAWLSDGEYVMPADKVKKLGIEKLEYIRKHGELPGFAYGGFVGNLSKNLSGFSDYLKEERLGMVGKDKGLKGILGLFAQGALASTEIATKLVNVPVSSAAGVESVAGYLGEKGIKGSIKDVKNIASYATDAVKTAANYYGEKGIKGSIKDVIRDSGALGSAAKSIGKGLYTSLAENIASGGTDITSGLIEAIGGADITKTIAGLKKTDLLSQVTKLTKSRNLVLREQATDLLESGVFKDILTNKAYGKGVSFAGHGTEALVFKKGKEALRFGGLESETALDFLKAFNMNFSTFDTNEKVLSRLATKVSPKDLNSIGAANKLTEGKLFSGNKSFFKSEFLKTKKLKESSIINNLKKQGAIFGDKGEAYLTDGKNYFKIEDLHGDNFGFDAKGNFKALDPGMFSKTTFGELPENVAKTFGTKNIDVLANISESAIEATTGKTPSLLKKAAPAMEAYLEKLKKTNPALSNIDVSLPNEYLGVRQVEDTKKYLDLLNDYAASAPEARTLKGVSFDYSEGSLFKVLEKAGKKVENSPGVYSPQTAVATFKTGVEKAEAVPTTFAHELSSGHHFDLTTTQIAKNLVTKNVDIVKKHKKSAFEFLRAHKDISQSIDEIVESGQVGRYVGPKALEQIAGDTKKIKKEVFAYTTEPKLQNDPLAKKIQAFRDLTMKDEGVKSLLNDYFNAQGYAEGGLVEKLKKWFLGDEGQGPEGKAGSYLESGKNKKERYDAMIGGYAEGGLVEKFKKWFLGDEGKGPEGKAGSYLESGKNKKERYDAMINGYAEGGKANDDELWALDTLKEADQRMLSARRGRGKAAKIGDEFMGIKAQYDTEQYQRALKKQENFKIKADARKDILKRADDIARATQARSAGLVNIGEADKTISEQVFKGMPADYEVMSFDKRRQLVKLDNDLVSYQSKKDLRALDYDKVPQPTDYMSDKSSKTFVEDKFRYNMFKAAKQDEQRMLMKKLFDPNTKVNYNDYPGYLGKLKKEFDKTNKAIETSVISDKEKRILSQRAARLSGVMQKISAGGEMLSPEIQTLSKLALSGGILKDFRPTGIQTYDKEHSSYRGLTNAILRRARGGKKPSEIGTTGYLGGAPGSTSVITSRMALKADERVSPTGPPSRITEQSITDIILKVLGGKTSNTADELDKLIRENNGAFSSRAPDFFSALFNRSAPAMHNGGIVKRTGMIFAEGGEVVLPKNTQTENIPASKTLNTSSIKLDASELLSKLESLELKVEDKEFTVEDKKFTVEDKEFKVEDKTFKVDAPTSIPVDLSNVPKVEVEQPTWSVSVEQPSWNVGVDVPTDTIKVEVDGSTAATALNKAVSNAVNDLTNALNSIDLSGVGKNAVGGERFDQLARTVETVKDQLIQVKGSLENDIKMLGSKNNETLDIDRRVANIVDNKISSIKQDLVNVRTIASDTASTQKQKEAYYDSRFTELDYRLNNALNITGIGPGGITI